MRLVKGNILKPTPGLYLIPIQSYKKAKTYIDLMTRHAHGSRKRIPGSDPKDLDPEYAQITDPPSQFADRSTRIIDPSSQ